MFDCGILVGETFGCGDQGVVNGDLSVKQGIQRQRWLGVVGLLDSHGSGGGGGCVLVGQGPNCWVL